MIHTGAITLYVIMGQYIPIDVAGLNIVEHKFAAHAYGFYGRVPIQCCINNATAVAQLNQVLSYHGSPV
jgi:hypothetical protein